MKSASLVKPYCDASASLAASSMAALTWLRKGSSAMLRSAPSELPGKLLSAQNNLSPFFCARALILIEPTLTLFPAQKAAQFCCAVEVGRANQRTHKLPNAKAQTQRIVA